MTVEQARDHMLNPPHAKRPWKTDGTGKIILSNGMRMAAPVKSTHRTYTQRKLERSRRTKMKK